MSMFNVNSASFHQVYVSGAIDLTGSINLTGSLLLDGKNIENVLSQESKYGRLQFHEVSPNDLLTGTNNAWNTFLGVYQFGFNSGSDWNNSKTSKINMSWYTWPTQQGKAPNSIFSPYSLQRSFGKYTDLAYSVHGHHQTYLHKLNEIMQNNLKEKYIIKFYHTDDSEIRKHFIIKDIKLYEPVFIISGSSHSNIPDPTFRPYDFFLTSSFSTWGMGSNFWDGVMYGPGFDYESSVAVTDMNLSSKKYNLFNSNIQTQTRVPGSFDTINNEWVTTDQADILSILQRGPYKTTPFETISGSRTTYSFRHFELEVEEIFSSTGSIEFNYDDLFWVDFEALPSKRKTIEIVSESKDIDIPSWAEKITVYSIGAGGGGGGGASGYRHQYVPYQYDTYEDFVLEVANLNLNDEWIPLSHEDGHPGSVGHEFVTGGGGGAGGCIAIQTIDGQDAKNAAGGKLNITIGSGGLGGSGSSYFDDVIAFDDKFTYPNEYEKWKLLEKLFPTTFDRGIHPQLFDYGIAAMSPYGNDYNGKPGGDTFVFLINKDGSSKKITHAQGGNGGTGGFALKKPYELFHYFCQVYEHFPGLIKVPGGANDGNGNLGEEIRIGGSGGYGVSMPIATKVYDQNIYINSNQTIRQRSLEFTKDMYGYPILNSTNIAPNTPFNKINILQSNRSFSHNDNMHSKGDWTPTSDEINYSIGYGNTTRVVNNNDDAIERYISNGKLIPDKPAPSGGGGGCGASYQGLMQLAKSEWIDEVYANPEHKNIFGIDLPQENFPEYLKFMSNWITGSIVYGFGGIVDFDEYLVNDTDDKNIVHKFPSTTWKNCQTANGGYAYYGTNKDLSLTDNLNNQVYNTNPTDMSQYYPQTAGFGGGGGAGTYVLSYDDRYTTETGLQYKNSNTPELYIADRGQNGANGQDGLTIVVIEQL